LHRELTGSCYAQHTQQEFLAFLNQLVKAYPECVEEFSDPLSGPN
jgi:hypothetical protein